MSADRERLIADAVAGSLSDANSEILAQMIEQDPNVRIELARQMAVDAWLRAAQAPTIEVNLVMRSLPVRGHVGSSVMRRVKSMPDRRSSDSRIVWLASAAAAVLVLILAPIVYRLYVPPRSVNPDEISIVERIGSVTVDEASTFALADDSRVVLAAGDGTKAELRGPAHMRVIKQGAATGLRFFLDQGRFDVETPARPTERQLIIDTAQSQITVVGTRFTVEANGQATVLTVAAGKVRFRPNDGQEQLIGPGERSEARSAPRLITVTASEDGIANEDQPDASFPHDDALSLGENPRRYGYIRFKLPTEPIHSATLVLTRLQGSQPIKAIFVAGPWHEATLTWNNRPDHGEEIGTLVAGLDGKLRLDVTPACINGECTIMLISPYEGESVTASREAQDGKPVLEITIAK